MSINEFILSSTKLLEAAGIATARLDCLVLLCDALDTDKAWVLSHSEDELQGSILNKLSTNVTQRAKHIPLAYIRKKTEFYGREFTVNPHTLVPRPETEAMIELLKVVRNMEADVTAWQVERRGRKPAQKQYMFEEHSPNSSLVKTDDGYKVVWQNRPKQRRNRSVPTTQASSLKHNDEQLCLVDIGTGSGAIAVTAQLEIPEATVLATDIDAACLAVAKQNASSLGADIHLLKGNLLEPLESFDTSPFETIVLLCNLPYVPDSFQINTAATHEPNHALFGGADGLDLYRELFNQTASYPWKPAYILTESLPPQHEALADIAEAAGYRLEKTDDFIQLFVEA